MKIKPGGRNVNPEELILKEPRAGDGDVEENELSGHRAHSRRERPPLSGSERLQLPRWAPSVHFCVSVGDTHLTLNHTTPLSCSCGCEFFSDFSRIV